MSIELQNRHVTPIIYLVEDPSFPCYNEFRCGPTDTYLVVATWPQNSNWIQIVVPSLCRLGWAVGANMKVA